MTKSHFSWELCSSQLFLLYFHIKQKQTNKKKEDDHCPKTFGVDSFELKMIFLLNKFFYTHQIFTKINKGLISTNSSTQLLSVQKLEAASLMRLFWYRFSFKVLTEKSVSCVLLCERTCSHRLWGHCSCQEAGPSCSSSSDLSKPVITPPHLNQTSCSPVTQRQEPRLAGHNIYPRSPAGVAASATGKRPSPLLEHCVSVSMFT